MMPLYVTVMQYPNQETDIDAIYKPFPDFTNYYMHSVCVHVCAHIYVYV